MAKRPKVQAVASAPRQTKVNYVVLERASEAAVDASLEAFAKIHPLPRQHDGTLRDKLLVGTQWMTAHANKDELAPCDNCEGFVDVTMLDRGLLPNVCPWCGVGDDEQTDADVSVVTNIEDYKQQRQAPEGAQPQPEQAEAEVVEAEGVEVVDTSEGPQEGQGGQKLTRVQKGSRKAGPKPSASALVQASARIDELIISSVSNMVQIGRELHTVSESFKAAKAAAGKDAAVAEVLGGAKSFEDYIRNRWSFHVNTAWRAIKVASEYGDEQIRKYGIRKLAVASRLNKEMDGLGKKLLDEGASASRMEDTLRNVKGGEDADQGPATIACAVPVKRNKLQLLNAKGKPAKSLTEELTAELDCGKARLKFAVRKTKKGAIELIVVPERG